MVHKKVICTSYMDQETTVVTRSHYGQKHVLVLNKPVWVPFWVLHQVSLCKEVKE